jgi:hypothetical protein
MSERVIVSCTDCGKVVMVVPRLGLSQWRRLYLHFGHEPHRQATRQDARRHVMIRVKTDEPSAGPDGRKGTEG